jgi:hypothetical protein
LTTTGSGAEIAEQIALKLNEAKTLIPLKALRKDKKAD